MMQFVNKKIFPNSSKTEKAKTSAKFENNQCLAKSKEHRQSYLS